jgi:hypothetical protein
LFRFYDPRVFATVLPVFNHRQVEEFFGPVNRFSVEASEGREILEFTQVDGVLKQMSRRIF